MKFYITTAIAYANAPPHMGFALELVQADVLARYHRQRGDDVFFLTGTDEHGSKIARTAAEQGKTPAELVNEIAPRFQKLADALHCSYSDFLRTSDRKRHWPGVQKFWQTLVHNDAIYKGTYRGYYCVGCEAFLTASDLVNGLCPIHKTAPEEIEEENYFFRLSRFKDAVRKTLESEVLRVIPPHRHAELLSFIEREGLNDVSFSRPREKLPWGIPVPGDNRHVIYVWADALPNYVTAVGYGRDVAQFQRWWPADMHVIGKDILRFHAIIWPAMLMAAGLELPRVIASHGFITLDGEKMSKSRGVVADPFSVIARHGADALRYYLLREIPSVEDGDFSEERFHQRYESDLANGLGNLVSRVIKLSERLHLASDRALPLRTLGADAEAARTDAQTAIDAFRFHDALTAIWRLIGRADKFLEEQKPWKSLNDNPDDAADVVTEALDILGVVTELVRPFLPETAEKIDAALSAGRIEHPLFPRLS